MALLFSPAVIPLERLARRFEGLAGYRLDPNTGMSDTGPTVETVEIIDIAKIPGKPPLVWRTASKEGLDHVKFSPDGRYLSAVLVADSRPARLAIYDIEKRKQRLLRVPINTAWGNPCHWVEGDALMCRLTPKDRGKLPAQHWAPVNIEHSSGAAPTRTYSNLLGSDYDDALFDYYFTSELGRVGTDGSVKRFPATRGLLYRFAPSGDGTLAIIKRLQRPYPRMVPASRFPNSIEVWDLETPDPLYRSEITGFGMLPQPGQDQEPRRIIWQPGATNTAGYIVNSSLEDGTVEHRWMSLAVPFTGEPQIIASSKKPIGDFGWTTAGTPYYSTRSEDDTHEQIHVVVDGKRRLLWSGEIEDRYHHPGRALRVNGATGAVLEHEGKLFVAGDGLGPHGAQPHLDRYDLRSQHIDQIYVAPKGVFEQVLGIVNPSRPILITSRETEAEPPNIFRIDGDKRTPLRPVANPYPQLDSVERRRISYARNDGVSLSGTLYLPENRVDGQPLPTLIWIYPYEFSDRDHAEQLDVRAFRFHRVKGPSPLAAVLEGYAVLVNPTVPIVHEGVGMNDNYIEQLVASAEAAAEYLVAEGISDPDRIAVGGRSYGAFSSANLLVHSDSFATAIAMSGAYNRSLTPFGFQHEKRSFWDATDLYTSISPFFHANEIEEPILLVHGAADPNPGTPPIQARRFFHALVGEGAHVRYVELPFEGHHYLARESVLDSANEMLMWLDKTLKQ